MKGKKLIKKLLMIVLVIVGIVATRMVYLGIESREMKPQIGLSEGQLAQCPQKPNCVSSQEDGEHFIEPIKSSLSMEEAKKRILSLPASKLDDEGHDYAHFTFKSKTFGFVDDVELYKSDGVFHVRSASRVGYSDMDANRNRVEIIRAALEDKKTN